MGFLFSEFWIVLIFPTYDGIRNTHHIDEQIDITAININGALRSKIFVMKPPERGPKAMPKRNEAW